MDKYIIGVMFQLCLVGVWHAIIGSYARNTADGDTGRVDRYELADRIVLGILLFIYVVFVLVFVLVHVYKKYKKDEEYGKLDKEHRENMDRAGREHREVYVEYHHKKKKSKKSKKHKTPEPANIVAPVPEPVPEPEPVKNDLNTRGHKSYAKDYDFARGRFNTTYNPGESNKKALYTETLK